MEPLKYTCKLFAGILVAALSVITSVHIYCNVALKVDNKTVEPFLDNMLERIETSSVGFLASVVLTGIGIFFMICALRGNVKLGLRFFFVSFYPIVPRETFINAFMANCLVVNLWMTALISFMNVMFRGYLRGTQAAKIF